MNMSFTDYKKFILREGAYDREKRYYEFYGRIIENSFVFTKDMMSKVKRALQCKKEISRHKYPESYQLAYLLRFGVHDTCFTVQKFYESVMEYTEIVEKLIWKNRIRICCMGGESLLAAIGICKVIEEANAQFGFLNDIPTEIQVFVIDKQCSWKNVCKHIVEEANSYYKNMELKLHYLAADLTEGFSDEITLRISNSHIVIMDRFLSQTFCLKVLKEFVKKILQKMKKRAILFYLDDCDQGNHETLCQLISEKDSFSEVRSSKEQYASLGSERYSLDFSFTWNVDFLPVISSTWIKYPGIKVKTPGKANVPMPATQMITSERGTQAKTSNKLCFRNTNYRIKLNGKFAHKDLEKKNKDKEHRQKAKELSTSRYASFDYDD